MWRVILRLVTVALVVVGVTACSSGNRAANSERVDITGRVYNLDAVVDASDCSSTTPSASLEGKTVSFQDWEGTVIAIAELGSTEMVPSDGHCVPYSTYSVSLPKLDYYHGLPPGHARPAWKSYEQLKSDLFRWDFGGTSGR